MDIDIRPITPDQGDQFSAVMAVAFGETFTAEELADHDRWFEYERSIAAFDGDRMVGTGGAYLMDMTLPGLTTIPIGGLTAISVLPTHRRRGILRSMIAYHFEECEGRGELVSGLGASESVIYGRFGYGLATTFANYEIDPRRGQFLRQPAGRGRLRLLEPEETAKIVPPLYDRYRRASRASCPGPRSGGTSTPATPSGPGKGPAAADVVYESDPGRSAAGSATGSRTAGPSGLAANIIKVRMLVGHTPEAEAALWRYLLDMDLAGSREAGRPADRRPDPLAAGQSKAGLRVTDVGDQLWLRLLDLPGRARGQALRRRGRGWCSRSPTPCAPATRAASASRAAPTAPPASPPGPPPTSAWMSPTSAPPTWAGTSLVSLVRAERVTELTGGALLRADRMFAASPPPICTTHF